jgi:hypothetical protein
MSVVKGLVTLQREEVTTGVLVTTFEWSVFVFVTVAQVNSWLGLVIVSTIVETPIFVVTYGEEAVSTVVLVWTSSTKIVVVTTVALGVSATSYQYQPEVRLDRLEGWFDSRPFVTVSVLVDNEIL